MFIGFVLVNKYLQHWFEQYFWQSSLFFKLMNHFFCLLRIYPVIRQYVPMPVTGKYHWRVKKTIIYRVTHYIAIS